MRDRVIDLGEVPAGAPEEPVLPRAPLPYRWILGPLAAILLIALGGAVPPAAPPPPPQVIPLTLRDAIRVQGDRLYLIGPGEPIGGEVRTHTIRAFALPGMTLSGTWTATIAGDISSLIDAGDGILLISSSTQNGAGAIGLTAVRAGSAEPLWRRAAGMFGLSDDRSTVLVYDDIIDPDLAPLHGLDPGTGKPRWTMPPPPRPGGWALRTGYFYTGFPGLVYLLWPDGRLEARETRDGRTTASTRTSLPVDSDTMVRVAGGLLMITRGGDSIAYDDTTLAERWRGGPLVGPDGYLVDCRPMICAVQGQDGLAGIDPATGRQVWRQDGWDRHEPLGDHVLLGAASRGDPELSVLDSRTGRITVRAGAWINGGPGPRPGTAYVHRILSIDNTMRYGVLDLATGKVRLLGGARWIAGDCRFGSGALICRRLDASAAVWRL
ncbi:PQQ-binding-like beta-propeller repeat protein [Actinoplanes flavus]|uniref:PQQ-binding-like beta-propeller repeat protein n=1 Tax=Actinoplanes flavus TaxID=2820290 RepID=A0ABS3UB98_9ACTN|nr:PQQ-binding-like beta-propeller repeat protein [Actinoplanes flavus]MBO3736050.1 PQQ-binding-like beta-propeller repeat protein [Actinoplanes flavus]